MSIKTVCTVVLVHAFEQAFQQDAFGGIGNILHSGEYFYTVVFEVFAVDRHFILVAGESV